MKDTPSEVEQAVPGLLHHDTPVGGRRSVLGGRIALVLVLALGACRGIESEDPPIHPNLNMDFQERFDPQEANVFFADQRAMRPPVPGTVARGVLREDTRFYLGRTEDGSLVQEVPLPVTMDLLERGRQRYNIYCSVCHGLAGDGLGVVITGNYGYTPAPSYHQDRLREAPDGHIYDVILNGVRSMPSYAQQIPVADRWAIVAYIRALQRAQYASRADVPAQLLPTLQPVAGTDTTATDTTANAAAPVAGGLSPDTTAAEPPANTPPVQN